MTLTITASELKRFAPKAKPNEPRSFDPMTEPINTQTLLTPAEIEYACQVMLSLNGAVGLYTTPERQPLLLTEIASWLLSAAMFLALRDNYKAAPGRQMADADLDATIEAMKAFVPMRAANLLASIELGRRQTAQTLSPHQPSVAQY